MLLNPPFVSVASAIASKSWSPEFLRFAALDEIEPSLAVEVADFGPGSDSPIVLDFRGHGRHPRVFRLEWMKPDTGSSDSHWVELAPTLDAFVNRIGI